MRIQPWGLVMAVLAASACAKGDKTAQQPADSAARNLTLAPTESSAALHDVPAPTAQPPAATPATPPPSRPPAPKPKPTPAPAAPAAPATRTAAAGSFVDLAVSDSLSSRFTKAGDAFTASVVSDVKDGQGRVVIPAGSTVHGSVTEVKPAPNPRTPGTLTLLLTSVTVGGTSYPIDARIDSLETVRQGRGVTGGDAAKVGAGAAAGAILGRVLGKNTKGAIIGGVVGGAVGAGVAAQSKDADIVLPKGAHINASLVSALTVRVS
jgi:pyruvate/2-oxoglutarate dehydrogenase complex dihydrolipoamide acyltransferase (E2) component